MNSTYASGETMKERKKERKKEGIEIYDCIISVHYDPHARMERQS